jgi:cysteinyl-tRNA synthetase
VEHGVERFIFASTNSVYGVKAGVMYETTIPEPVSLYARLKLRMEERILKSKQSGFHPTVLRIATCHGSAGNVYFDVNKFGEYGKLAQLDLNQLRAGARIEVDQNKRSPLDFALWFTKSKFENQELQWDSPWGKGYPGWHIECSAMAMHYLGETFDIHCGGIDHIPVHHTNEIAQSEGATGKPFANCWLHGGFLVVGKDKMAKSSGGFLTLDKVGEHGYDPISYRLLCLSGSYRNELAWSWEALENANNTLRRLKNSVLSWKQAGAKLTELSDVRCDTYRSAFESHCYNDLAMPSALAILHEVVADTELSAERKFSLLSVFDQILGLGIESWEESSVADAILKLAAGREQARKDRNWKLADELRDQIASAGYTIEDTATGTRVRKK